MIQFKNNLQVFLFGLALLSMQGQLAQAEEMDQTQTQTHFYAEDIKEAMHLHLREVLDQEGLFHIQDDVTDESLTLTFSQIHDPVRQIGSDIYFACTDFKISDQTDQVYDIDFWLRENQGQLKVFRTKIHKEPRKSLLYGWYKHPRYTFVNDQIQYLYDD